MLLALTEAQKPEIHHFGINLMDEKLTEEDDIDFNTPDIQDNKNKEEERLVQQSNFFQYWKVARRN